jgi:peptidoglycan/LPS O-acetylase OafA/YrhL
VAKRKRRKSAGPPPAHNPKRAALEASGETPNEKAPKRKPGEPVPPRLKGVLVRAGIVAAIFYLALVTVVGENPGAALIVVLLALAVMIPLGMFFDRWRYKRDLRRWEERRAGPSR